MNRLIIIGNGFDLAHGLKTSYKDFINWYWEQRSNTFYECTQSVSEDCLCKLKIHKNELFSTWSSFASHNSFFKNYDNTRKCTGLELFQFIKENREYFAIKYTHFFERITKCIEDKGWVDIENEYYELLKKYSDNIEECKKLNKQLDFLREKLKEYLKTLPSIRRNDDILAIIIDEFNEKDFSTIDREKASDSMNQNEPTYPKYTMLLSFNYTKTTRYYIDQNWNFDISINYIHGELSTNEELIFGYGDELDKDYNDLRDRNDNELLRYIKSVKYLETSHYKKMLEFIESAPFQVFIMGHSCGNSDRTLLNTVFEHENCVSIKPFYYVKPDGTDTYLELVQNISRNFTNPKLFRDRVVNKELCQELPQNTEDTNE